MKKIKVLTIFSIIFLFIICSVSFCHAGWDKVEWGMDLNRIQSIYQNKLTDVSKEFNKGIPVFEIKQEIIGKPFVVLFDFDAKTDIIKRVFLKYDGKDSPEFFTDLKTALITKYGKPTTNANNEGIPASITQSMWLGLKDTIIKLYLVTFPAHTELSCVTVEYTPKIEESGL
jgi:hypothetical protein